MKKIITMIMAALSAFAVSAQQTLVATLSKSNGEVTQYYGIQAFQEAYSAAENGESIYLSSGVFYGTNINKAITITGAGMGNLGTFLSIMDNLDDYNTNNGNISLSGDDMSSMTIISNDMTINIIEDGHFKMEGIATTNNVSIGALTNGQFLRCTFGGEISNNTLLGYNKDCSFINCIIPKSRLQNSEATIVFINSWIRNISEDISPKLYIYENCYINLYSNETDLIGSQLNNCIIKGTDGTKNIKDTILTNCLICYYSNIEKSIINNIYDIENFLGIFKENTFFELTDEAAYLYKGIDDTQIGLYGGMYPFEFTPTNPQIISLEVPSQSTSSGTLPVTITVK